MSITGRVQKRDSKGFVPYLVRFPLPCFALEDADEFDGWIGDEVGGADEG